MVFAATCPGGGDEVRFGDDCYGLAAGGGPLASAADAADACLARGMDLWRPAAAEEAAFAAGAFPQLLPATHVGLRRLSSGGGALGADYSVSAPAAGADHDPVTSGAFVSPGAEDLIANGSRCLSWNFGEARIEEEAGPCAVARPALCKAKLGNSANFVNKNSVPSK